jgi:hypothetical protein
VGVVIGLNDTLFSSTQVAITTISATATATANANSSGPSSLGLGAKVGIVIGSLVALLILAGCSLVWWKKKQRKTFLESKYDPRFGTHEITAPNAVAFVNPYQISRTSKTFVRYNPREFNDTENSPGKPKSSPANTDSSWSSGQPSNPFNGGDMPVHQAYIPNPRQGLASPEPHFSAPNRVRSFSKPTNTYATSSQGNSSAKSSPTTIPPYNPSTYVPRQGSENTQATWEEAPHRAGSLHSVELWPGTM